MMRVSISIDDFLLFTAVVPHSARFMNQSVLKQRIRQDISLFHYKTVYEIPATRTYDGESKSSRTESITK